MGHNAFKWLLYIISFSCFQRSQFCIGMVSWWVCFCIMSCAVFVLSVTWLSVLSVDLQRSSCRWKINTAASLAVALWGMCIRIAAAHLNSESYSADAVDCHQAFLYRAILHSWTDSLHSCHIWFSMSDCHFSVCFEYLPKWCTYSTYWLVHGWCHVKLLLSWHVLCKPYNHAPCHFMQSHIYM